MPGHNRRRALLARRLKGRFKNAQYISTSVDSRDRVAFSLDRLGRCARDVNPSLSCFYFTVSGAGVGSCYGDFVSYRAFNSLFWGYVHVSAENLRLVADVGMSCFSRVSDFFFLQGRAVCVVVFLEVA